ncbi:50S ribosomal protein L16 [Geodia barretti]|nr:50S ribosomal protein L16 [Geodia barretti]
MKGVSNRGSALAFGDFGLKAVDASWVTSRQIESGRRAITGYVQRGGQVWIRIFPDKPVSSRPAETRMGGGKGAVDHWVAPVRRGRIIYEIADVSEAAAREALRRAGAKFPMAVKIVSRADEL